MPHRMAHGVLFELYRNTAAVLQLYKVLAVARCRAQHTRAGRNRDVLVQVYHFTGILSSNQLDLS